MFFWLPSLSFLPSSKSADVIIPNRPGRIDSLLGPDWKLDCERKAQKQRSDDNDHDDKLKNGRNDEQQRNGTHALTTTQRGTSTVGSTDSCSSTTVHEVIVAAYAGCITTFIDHQFNCRRLQELSPLVRTEIVVY
jgi:hypothetical protein